MRLAGLDWAVVIAYLAIALGIGLWFRGRASRSLTDYFVSGRSLPWWLAGTSMVATTFAADTPLVITGWVRSAGIWKNWLWWCFVTTSMLGAFLFAPLWRRGGVMTKAELAELRYSGRPAAVLRAVKAVYFGLFVNVLAMAWVVAAMVKISRSF
ncbi:MAG: sodium:proline symporter, partial [Gemmatimonadota bacterium]